MPFFVEFKCIKCVNKNVHVIYVSNISNITCLSYTDNINTTSAQDVWFVFIDYNALFQLWRKFKIWNAAKRQVFYIHRTLDFKPLFTGYKLIPVYSVDILVNITGLYAFLSVRFISSFMGSHNSFQGPQPQRCVSHVAMVFIPHTTLRRWLRHGV